MVVHTLTLHAFVGNIVDVEALGTVSCPNFVAVFRLWLRGGAHKKHD